MVYGFRYLKSCNRVSKVVGLVTVKIKPLCVKICNNIIRTLVLEDYSNNRVLGWKQEIKDNCDKVLFVNFYT